MNSFPNPIDLEYPYDATAERLSTLRSVLTVPQVRPFPIIFDNDIFRALFHIKNEKNIQLTSLSTPLPPKEWFNDVYNGYRSGALKVVMSNDHRVKPHLHNESARRLFSDVADVRPSGKTLFSLRELLYNGHQVAWRLFECVVEVYGDRLDSVRFVRFTLNCDLILRIEPPKYRLGTRGLGNGPTIRDRP
jgi:hypothetical protein